MHQPVGNGLSLIELAQIEEAAHRSQTFDARIVLRLAAALRDALQEKENASALVVVYKRIADQHPSVHRGN